MNETNNKHTSVQKVVIEEDQAGQRIDSENPNLQNAA